MTRKATTRPTGTAPSKNDLVGKLFHSVEEKNGITDIAWQGHVIGNPEPGIYIIQLFSWICGSSTICKLKRIDEMMNWLFYQSHEDFIHSYEHGTARGIKKEADRKRDKLKEQNT